MPKNEVRADPEAARARVLSHALGEVARRLDIGSSQLAPILGISQSTASRLLREEYQLQPGRKEFELAAYLVRLYRSLHPLVNGSDLDAKRWLRADNLAFYGRAPMTQLTSIAGLLDVCNYLDRHRATV